MFSCSVCDKTLTRICSLRRHAKSHDVSNKISCNICSQVFTRRDNLIRHSKEKHRSNIVIQPTNLKPTEQIYDYEVPSASNRNSLKRGHHVENSNEAVNVKKNTHGHRQYPWFC